MRIIKCMMNNQLLSSLYLITKIKEYNSTKKKKPNQMKEQKIYQANNQI